jgi:hypothetical protein
MKTKSDLADYIRPLVILTAVISSAVTAHANPIEFLEKPMTPEISFLVGFALLIEILCICFMLRRSRRP